VVVNCPAIPENLFERELFGHSRGAFSGAEQDRIGLCEAADGGTLFLDEVGEMPLNLQPKLLRLLQEGTYRRLGEVAERKVNFRIVAATNADLGELMSRGQFRADLYFRLQVVPVVLPPLRERGEEIDPLVALSVRRVMGPAVAPADVFAEEVLVALRRYPWPGNVRELEGVVRRLALVAARAGKATVGSLPVEMARWLDRPSGVHRGSSLAVSLERAERERIVQALTAAEGNRTVAARMLDISRASLYRKMERLGIRIPA
jgi:transcriptional regulator with GAF, ATPase, and Fis domain